jgi:hypothetical protein
MSTPTPIIIRFETIDGINKFRSEIMSNSSILDIRLLISQRFQSDGIVINTANINLVCNNIILNDDTWCLSDYNIQSNSLIQIVPKITSSLRNNQIDGMNNDIMTEVREHFRNCNTIDMSDEDKEKIFDTNKIDKTRKEKIAMREHIKMKSKEYIDKHGLYGFLVNKKTGKIITLNKDQLRLVKYIRDNNSRVQIDSSPSETQIMSLFNCVMKHNNNPTDDDKVPPVEEQGATSDDTSITPNDKMMEIKRKLEEAKNKRKDTINRANNKL